MRACSVAERAGVSSYAIVSTGFLKQARAIARAVGISSAWIAEYPGVVPNDSAEVVERKVLEHVLPSLLQGFATPAEALQEVAEPGPSDVVFKGALDEVQEHFTERLWTDGLPIVPPTQNRVEAFLRWTDRDALEVIGVLPPEQREATVWNVAVNGVMAGCRPEYFPILLAAVEAIADPEFRLEDAGATPGWEPLIILSGPLSKRLHFNSEGGALRIGRQANSSIGRFLRLYMRNVAGLRTPPGDTDKAAIGMNFNVVLAENEDAVTRIGWPPFRVDRGFSMADDVVTVQSVVAISPHIYSGGSSALEHIEPIVRFMEGVMGPVSPVAITYRRSHPLIVMSPSVAQAFADGGWDKDAIRSYLFEHLTIDAGWVERYPLHASGASTSLATMVRERGLPAHYAESDDPRRRLPILIRPEWTSIVLAGEPGRNQCRVYVQQHEQGAPVSKKVRLAADAEVLRAPAVQEPEASTEATPTLHR